MRNWKIIVSDQAGDDLLMMGSDTGSYETPRRQFITSDSDFNHGRSLPIDGRLNKVVTPEVLEYLGRKSL